MGEIWGRGKEVVLGDDCLESLGAAIDTCLIYPHEAGDKVLKAWAEGGLAIEHPSLRRGGLGFSSRTKKGRLGTT